MAVLGRKKQFALDSNLLFDLAAEMDFAHTFREVYQERGYYARVKQCAETPLALKALQEMRGWHLTPFDLRPAGHGIAEQFSLKLMGAGLLPEDEFNDGLILAEAALEWIPLLVSSDGDLLNIEEAALRVQFEEADLEPVQVFHPKLLLKAMAPRQAARGV
jgi:hypothetical protein